ncbi:Thiosulfate sulfurtransferase, rhodanese [Marinobacterium lacunae]|uniref:Thiosulfate sulfurtransferase, rhodanese n=1 Tax=Marinobacterium lacunae TaxID=1232683 RepID=A0A081FT78_9GAMM|nr:sulfurtransferase [Marinobacterium lacunae]KEA61733.1 Thiosulfate sulfurtransferase, rhodanese [Marinobacterium lacunae]
MYDTLIEVDQLKALDNPLIFDCRFTLSTQPGDRDAGARAFVEGHIPGAFYLHLEDDLSSPITPSTGRHPLPDPDCLQAKLRAAGACATRQVVLYDASGGAFAARGWWLLRWLGYRNVAVLNGGWQAWLGADAEVESGERPITPLATDSPVQPQRSLLLSVDALQQALEQDACLLIDARAPERFRGDVEPLDPVAGHVPGADNLPFTDNLVDGRFAPAEQLRSRWSAFLAGKAADQVVHMCGSGVTACVNLLAMEHAGLSGSRLYAGSWSEWIRDPKRPVATGPACR